MRRILSGGSLHEVRYGSYYPGRSFEVLATCGARFQMIEGAPPVAGHQQASWSYDDVTCAECARRSGARDNRSDDEDT